MSADEPVNVEQQSSKTSFFLDEPTPFDTKENWELHLEKLLSLPESAPMRAEMIETATSRLSHDDDAPDPDRSDRFMWQAGDFEFIDIPGKSPAEVKAINAELRALGLARIAAKKAAKSAAPISPRRRRD